MIMRFVAVIIPVFIVVACVSPEHEAGQRTVTVAAYVYAGEPIAGNPQAQEAWWPVRFADENQCIMQGYQQGTDALAQCVKLMIDQQSRPHRPAYVRSLD